MNKPIDMCSVVLITDRLVLRAWKQSDLDDFYEYARVDGVGQMAGWLPHESKEVSQSILDRFIAGKKTFAIELDGKVIGSVGVEAYNEENFPELDSLQGRAIGYVLSKAYWGQGIMPEAVQAVLTWLFESVQLDFVLISHFTWNRQSRRVIEKCGLQFYKNTTHTTRFGTTEDACEHIIYNPAGRNKLSHL